MKTKTTKTTKTIKAIKKEPPKTDSADLVDFLIKEMPHCFDRDPKTSVRRDKVEKMVAKL